MWQSWSSYLVLGIKAENVTSSGADRQLLSPNLNTASIQILLAVIEWCVCVCMWPSLVSRLHHLHLFTDLSSDKSIPNRATLRATLCAQELVWQHSVSTGQDSDSQLSPRQFSLCLQLSFVLTFSLPFSFPFLCHACSVYISCSLHLPCYELNLGCVMLTDWLMCGFCKLCRNKHRPLWATWELGSVELLDVFCCPPHKLSRTVHIKYTL